MIFRFHFDIKDSRHRRKWTAKVPHKKSRWSSKRVDNNREENRVENKEGGQQRRWTAKRADNKVGGQQRMRTT